MRNRFRQDGMTFISLLLLLALIGFFALLIMKLTPMYLESFKVSSSLTRLASDPEVTSWSKGEIRRRLINHMDIEDVDRFNQRNIKEFLTITKTKNSVVMAIDYQAEVSLFYNLSLLADFHKVAESE